MWFYFFPNQTLILCSEQGGWEEHISSVSTFIQWVLFTNPILPGAQSKLGSREEPKVNLNSENSAETSKLYKYTNNAVLVLLHFIYLKNT